jgi:hypothetical protein
LLLGAKGIGANGDTVSIQWQHPTTNLIIGNRTLLYGFTVQVSGGAVTFNKFTFSTSNASENYFANAQFTVPQLPDIAPVVQKWVTLHSTVQL